MKYVYPAIITYDGEAYLVDFPDLPDCFTDGQTPEEALENAADALNLFLWHYEKNKRSIPVATSITSLKAPESGFISLIKADTLAYARQNDKRAVRKNLSIPQWLNTLAVENNINFSNVLQKALMQELNVTDQ